MIANVAATGDRQRMWEPRRGGPEIMVMPNGSQRSISELCLLLAPCEVANMPLRQTSHHEIPYSPFSDCPLLRGDVGQRPTGNIYALLPNSTIITSKSLILSLNYPQEIDH